MKTKIRIVMVMMMIMVMVMMMIMMMMPMVMVMMRSKDSPCFHGLTVPPLALKFSSNSSGSVNVLEK